MGNIQISPLPQQYRSIYPRRSGSSLWGRGGSCGIPSMFKGRRNWSRMLSKERNVPTSRQGSLLIPWPSFGGGKSGQDTRDETQGLTYVKQTLPYSDAQCEERSSLLTCLFLETLNRNTPEVWCVSQSGPSPPPWASDSLCLSLLLSPT